MTFFFYFFVHIAQHKRKTEMRFLAHYVFDFAIKRRSVKKHVLYVRISEWCKGLCSGCSPSISTPDFNYFLLCVPCIKWYHVDIRGCLS